MSIVEGPISQVRLMTGRRAAHRVESEHLGGKEAIAHSYHGPLLKTRGLKGTACQEEADSHKADAETLPPTVMNNLSVVLYRLYLNNRHRYQLLRTIPLLFLTRTLANHDRHLLQACLPRQNHPNLYKLAPLLWYLLRPLQSLPRLLLFLPASSDTHLLINPLHPRPLLLNHPALTWIQAVLRHLQHLKHHPRNSLLQWPTPWQH